MKTPLEWINQVGEAAGQDMFCGNPYKPGSQTEDVIKAIQSDAQSDLLTKNQSLQKERDEAYGKGVAAGKLESANYTPEERERYGKWVAQHNEWQELKEQNQSLQLRVKELEATVSHLHENRQQKIDAHKERDVLRLRVVQLEDALRLVKSHGHVEEQGICNCKEAVEK